MEDGLNDPISDVEDQESGIKNGVVTSIMANFPEGTVAIPNKENKSNTESSTTIETTPKVNGDTNVKCDQEYSSESDALVIDESVPKKPIKKKRSLKIKTTTSNKKVAKENEKDVLTHSNPYFNESLFELSQKAQNNTIPDVTITPTTTTTKDKPVELKKGQSCKFHKAKQRKAKTPKREYAQYLGLQPTVQFKCPKCGQSGYDSLASLNTHRLQCDAAEPTSNQNITEENSSSSFKIKRKVFLCSACGTYYENCNLYLHMFELHKRFICLYCLGMFSASEDLCQHIQSHHNFEPGHKNSLDEFFSVYNEPCYVICCECNKLFSEGDNFFYHNCTKSNVQQLNNSKSLKNFNNNKGVKNQIRPENHVTGDSQQTNQLEEVQQQSQQQQEDKEIVESSDNKLLTIGEEQPDIAPSNNTSSDNNISENSESENLDSSGKQNIEETLAVTTETNESVILTVSDDISSIANKSELTESQIPNKEEPSELKVLQEVAPQIESPAEVPPEKDFLLEGNLNEDSLLDDLEKSDEGSPYHNHESNMDQEKETNNTGDFLDDEEDDNNSLPTGGGDDNYFEEDDEDVDIDEEFTAECDNNMEMKSLNGSEIFSEEEEQQQHIETRKVPKLSLKLPKLNSFQKNNVADSDDDNDSEKLAMEVEQIESENEGGNNIIDENNLSHDEENDVSNGDIEEKHEIELENSLKDPFLQVAGQDVSIIELELEQPLDKFDIRVLLQKCLKASAPFCIYCNHARKIAVNGKQLGLHAITEHRFSAIVNSITAEELIPESFVSRIQESLDDVSETYFSLESSASDEAVTFSHIFECFQCRYSTTIHKELYLHNRKLHTKNLLLCIMCKSNFYSYSELICHLCPGLYILDYDLQFRCCMCVSDNLPSSFRLMVHLRKRHHVCDVCLEMCHNQYRLSNHVWKHKLHHFCYRCGIAYRNKPDITRHLFWKHGTESVLCKKCLQKKWPHVYHFCVPPVSFLCDECNLTFSKAVALKVHKRIHSNNKPHSCTAVEDCTETFISKKLLHKHELKHFEPVEEPKKIEEIETIDVQEINNTENEKGENDETNKECAIEEKIEDKPKPKVDICDLPELNLSESDSSSDSEQEETPNKITEDNIKTDENSQPVLFNENSLGLDLNIPEDNNLDFNLTKTALEKDGNDDMELEKEIVTQEPTTSDSCPPVLENIWDDFKNYQAEKEKIDHLFDKEKTETSEISEQPEEESLTAETALKDHDYCFNSEQKPDTSLTEVKPDLSQRVDHDYCSPKGHNIHSPNKTDEHSGNGDKNKKSPRKRTNSSSSSSSGSGSSSCTCGSNCSCSSSSGSSSSSSDSSNSDSSTEEGRKKQQLRRARRRERAKQMKAAEQEKPVKKVEVTSLPVENPVIIETPILETDLETTESETDEEFYDRQPHKIAKKILEEKRNQLLAEVGSLPPNGSWLESSRPATPNLPEESKPKKKSKSKKKKKRKSERREQENHNVYVHNSPQQLYHQQPPLVAPLTISLSARNSPIPHQQTHTIITQAGVYPKINSPLSRQDSSDSSLRASKRRRVPNKFYGYSSDEEGEKGAHHIPKWRKTENYPQLPPQPLLVPPLTIKTTQIIPQPPIEPITIRPTSHPGEMRVLQKGVMTPPIRMIPPRPLPVPPMQHQFHQQQVKDSGSDSNDSDSEENNHMSSPPKPNTPQLYCYCRCPYDEVSEMIGCDSNDCAIEWFHFECVGIMVPPKGQWFCPDCRKKKQQRRELLQT